MMIRRGEARATYPATEASVMAKATNGLTRRRDRFPQVTVSGTDVGADGSQHRNGHGGHTQCRWSPKSPTSPTASTRWVRGITGAGARAMWSRGRQAAWRDGKQLLPTPRGRHLCEAVAIDRRRGEACRRAGRKLLAIGGSTVPAAGGDSGDFRQHPEGNRVARNGAGINPGRSRRALRARRHAAQLMAMMVRARRVRDHRTFQNA